jgi:L-ascorbate metabolism protein UlaG (beta-lactamase superfamily)
MLITLLVTTTFLLSGGWLFMNQKQFGAVPEGKRLERIIQSPNYKNGAFQNITKTEVMSEESSTWKLLKAYMEKVEGKEADSIPFVQTDIKAIQDTETVVIWFGHSSYYIKTNGKHFLVDPVFCGNASPFSFMVKSFKGANHYQVDDFPELDAVIISHDHYDHLDHQTITKLIPKTKKFMTALGVGAHLEYWGVGADKIIEMDWWERVELDSDIVFTAAPARHFSGRKFKRAQTLWASFVMQTPTVKIFIGGDSGYDSTFKKIGEKFGPFDLAILECGQYNAYWKSIHMMPEETAIAAKELQAKLFMPVHNSKFNLALHPWKEPLAKVSAAAEKMDLAITTPMIGEPLVLGKHTPKIKWWENLK